jgi:hypothetical protein
MMECEVIRHGCRVSRMLGFLGEVPKLVERNEEAVGNSTLIRSSHK